MTDRENMESLRELRRVLATRASALSAEFSLLGNASNLPEVLKLARCELDLINSLLGIIDISFPYIRDSPVHETVITMGETIAREECEAAVVRHPPPISSPGKKRGRPKPPPSPPKAVLAMELESGEVLELPSVSEAVRACGISYGLVAKIASITSAGDWARGAEYLANAALRHSKGWALIYKENLENGNDD